ncbi:MAG: hypothetical protein AB7C96_04900 [Hydrogenovibrio sp.]
MDETTAISPELATAVNSGVDLLSTDGTSAIAAVGAVMLTLAALAVLFKWVKAAFFS